ncbi:uncharacterized protein BDR25DRAFT_201735, partial [Lindgomyces ingoldianus]
YLLPIPILIFYSLSLTGCVSTSPGISNIFTVKLQRFNETSSLLSEVRLGYFGVCASVSNGLSCSPSSGKSVDALFSSLIGPNSNTTSNLSDDSRHVLSMALDIQSKIIIYLLAVAGVLFAISLFFISLLKGHFRMAGIENVNAGKRIQMLRKVSMMTMWGSVAFALASAISINQATSAMEFITRVDSSSSIEITAGKTLNILQWLLFAFSTLFA